MDYDSEHVLLMDVTGVHDMLGGLRAALEARYGDTASERELNLICTGARLMVLGLQKAVHMEAAEEGVSYPPGDES
jgi:hypothetical protein